MMTVIAPARVLARRLLIVAAAALLGLSARPGAAADRIRIGVVQSEGGAAAYVALARGYFKDAGLDVAVTQFASAAPIAVAAASGDIDFGSTAMTAAFCNLAHDGTLHIIGSGGWERPGFQTIGFLVSNQAYEAGLHAFKDARGHSVGITQLGTPLEYDLARILEKYAIPLSAVRVIPLQSNPNVASALKGGQVDIGAQTVANIYPLIARGDAKLLGRAADELDPGQSTVTFTTDRMAREHPDIVDRFLAAFRKGSATWDAAFLDAAGHRKDQPDAAAMIAIVADALHVAPDIVARGIGYFDPQDRIRLADVQGVLDWYLANGMVKTPMDAAALIDKRFVILTE
jgi:NitT/TauT family transport system substrate-binding protein